MNENARHEVADAVTRVVVAFTPRERGQSSSILRWAFPFVATLLVAVVQYALIPEPTIAPFVFFYVSIALSGGLAGRGPGLLSVLLSASTANYVFMAPVWKWSLSGPALTATVLFLVGGTLVALVCAAFRSSVLRLDEQKRMEQRFRAVYDLGLIGVVYWTIDGRITGANDRFLAMTGYSREDVEAGRIDWRNMTSPEWRHLDEKALEDLRNTGRSPPVEKEYIRKDGTRQPILIGGAMLDESRHEGVAFVIDIGDRKRAEEARKGAEAERDKLIAALKDADRRKDEFLGMLSHELRNPLAPIRNSLYILARSAPGGEQARRALAVIDRQVQHTTRLVDDLLDVTRITRGKIRLQCERVDLGDLARRAADDYRDLFAKGGIRLDVTVEAEPVVVNADPTRIAQVIGNLLQNAAKFTPSGGRTTLTVERTGGFGLVSVRDTGAGISPEVLARLFEPFVQADSTLDRSTGGLGLGLALVKGLAELHGGTATAESGGVGRGATFTVRLPLERRMTPRLTVVVSARPEPRLAGRVLVVEDNVDAAATLKEALELNGHLVSVAHTGPEGLENARAMKPDVILCDIGLPGMDGFHVARAIRADPTLAAVGLIALSGYAQAEDLERSREAGFDLHLAKPPDMDALERAIAEVRASVAATTEPASSARPLSRG